MAPVQRPHPPLWCGTSNPEGTGWFAQHRVNCVTNAPAKRARAITDRYREEWEKLGRKPSELPFMGMARHIIVAETEDEAMKAGKPAYEKWFKSFMLLWNRYGTKPPNVALPEDFTDFVRGGFAFVGTPDVVRERMLEEIEAAGINYMLCRFAFGDLPHEVVAALGRALRERGDGGSGDETPCLSEQRERAAPFLLPLGEGACREAVGGSGLISRPSTNLALGQGVKRGANAKRPHPPRKSEKLREITVTVHLILGAPFIFGRCSN